MNNFQDILTSYIKTRTLMQGFSLSLSHCRERAKKPLCTLPFCQLSAWVAHSMTTKPQALLVNWFSHQSTKHQCVTSSMPTSCSFFFPFLFFSFSPLLEVSKKSDQLLVHVVVFSCLVCGPVETHGYFFWQFYFPARCAFKIKKEALFRKQAVSEKKQEGSLIPFSDLLLR